MGGSTNEIVYSVPVSLKSEKPGESRVYRHPESVVSLLEYPAPGINSVKAIWLDMLKKCPKNDFLGSQVKKGEATVYEYDSYEAVDRLARKLGSALKQGSFLTHASEGKVQLELVGIFSKNRKEWLYCDVASMLYKFQLVPLYDTLGLDSIEYILDQTQIATCFVTDQTLKTLLKLKNLVGLRRLVSYDPVSEEMVKQVADRGLGLIFIGEVISKVEEPLPLPEVGPHDCYTFSYTSGSTSWPKGVMLSHLNFTAICASFIHDKQLRL